MLNTSLAVSAWRAAGVWYLLLLTWSWVPKASIELASNDRVWHSDITERTEQGNYCNCSLPQPLAEE